MRSVPVIDLRRYTNGTSGDQRSIAKDVDAVCRELGFLVISGHGVDAAAVSAMWRAARDFFDLDTAEKAAIAPPRNGYPYGYFAPETEVLARSRGDDTPPDLKESFNIGPLSRPGHLGSGPDIDFCFAPNLWPIRPQGFRETCTAWYVEMGALAATIMRLFASALDLPPDYFAGKTQCCISAMRLLNYPRRVEAPRRGQLRAGAHTDYGSLTILLPDAEADGLQILHPDGKWRPVAAPVGTFVINLGDLMARWTNDRWVSTLHRVVDDSDGRRRQSIAFFQQPDWNAEIACIPTCLGQGESPRYAPVRSGPYLMSRFTRTVDARP